MEPIENLSLLPTRQRGSYSNEHFRTSDILTNYYRVEISNIKTICIFSVKFEPSIPPDSTRQRVQLLNKALPEIAKYIDNPVISSMNLFSVTPSKETKFEVKAESYNITIKQVKKIEGSEDMRPVLNFLNIALRNVMYRHNYS